MSEHAATRTADFLLTLMPEVEALRNNPQKCYDLMVRKLGTFAADLERELEAQKVSLSDTQRELENANAAHAAEQRLREIAEAYAEAQKRDLAKLDKAARVVLSCDELGASEELRAALSALDEVVAEQAGPNRRTEIGTGNADSNFTKAWGGLHGGE